MEHYHKKIHNTKDRNKNQKRSKRQDLKLLDDQATVSRTNSSCTDLGNSNISGLSINIANDNDQNIVIVLSKSRNTHKNKAEETETKINATRQAAGYDICTGNESCIHDKFGSTFDKKFFAGMSHMEDDSISSYNFSKNRHAKSELIYSPNCSSFSVVSKVRNDSHAFSMNFQRSNRDPSEHQKENLDEDLSYGNRRHKSSRSSTTRSKVVSNKFSYRTSSFDTSSEKHDRMRIFPFSYSSADTSHRDSEIKNESKVLQKHKYTCTDESRIEKCGKLCEYAKKNMESRETRYAITRVTKYDDFTTYEVLKSTRAKPRVIPCITENIFIIHKPCNVCGKENCNGLCNKL